MNIAGIIKMIYEDDNDVDEYGLDQPSRKRLRVRVKTKIKGTKKPLRPIKNKMPYSLSRIESVNNMTSLRNRGYVLIENVHDYYENMLARVGGASRLKRIIGFRNERKLGRGAWSFQFDPSSEGAPDYVKVSWDGLKGNFYDLYSLEVGKMIDGRPSSIEKLRGLVLRKVWPAFGRLTGLKVREV